MFDFSSSKKRNQEQAILPMINVVFLLLIFFLISAQIAPRAPFFISIPLIKTSQTPQGNNILFMLNTGELYFQGHHNKAALDAISKKKFENNALILRADHDVPAVKISVVLNQLQTMGIFRIEIIGRAQ